MGPAKSLATVGAALLAATALAACAPANADPEVDRPAPDATNLPALVTGINASGLALYLAAREDGENTAVSPVSIALAFGMADAGASDSVAVALEDFFGFPAEGEARLHAFNALEQTISSEGDGEVVRIANRIFTDSAFEPRDDYRTALATYFGAGAEAVPMATNGEAAAKRINDWISDRTEGLIEDLVKPEMFNDLSRAMLANTVYMNADWEQPFTAEATSPHPFTLLDGSTVQPDMMWQHGAVGEVVTGDGWVAATKPYIGGDREMLIVLPDAGTFTAVEDDLAAVLAQIDDGLTPAEYILALPKFTAESSTDLREVMEGRLGVTGLFDVVGLDGIGPELSISSAAHGVKVIVDEEGTEAAAATVVGMAGTSAPAEPEFQLIADRPFIYVIRDTATDAILFVGRVLDPS